MVRFTTTIAKFRVGLTHASSWVAPIQFLMVLFLTLSSLYGWFTDHFFHVDFWAYIATSYGACLVGFGLVVYWSANQVYEGEVDFFVTKLEEGGYRIVKAASQEQGSVEHGRKEPAQQAQAGQEIVRLQHPNGPLDATP